MSTKKLTEAQKRVMKWLGHGWTAEPANGSAIHINGQRRCNIDTMMSLKRAGYVVQDDLRCWKATPEGCAITEELGL